MRPGDTPRFRPGIQNPAGDLNALAGQVGQLAGLIVAPPLFLEGTPAGPVLRLHDDSSDAARELPAIAVHWNNVATGHVINPGTSATESDVLTLATPGWYLVSGVFAVSPTDPGFAAPLDFILTLFSPQYPNAVVTGEGSGSLLLEDYHTHWKLKRMPVNCMVLTAVENATLSVTVTNLSATDPLTWVAGLTGLSAVRLRDLPVE